VRIPRMPDIGGQPPGLHEPMQRKDQSALIVLAPSIVPFHICSGGSPPHGGEVPAHVVPGDGRARSRSGQRSAGKRIAAFQALHRDPPRQA